MLADSGAIRAADLLLVLGGVACVAALGAAVGLVRAWLRASALAPRSDKLGEPSRTHSFALSAVIQTAVLGALIVSAVPQVGAVLGPETSELLATLRLEATTPVEAAVVVQGYYEHIADAPLQASPLLDLPWRPKSAKPPGAEYTEFTRPVDAFLERELIPGWSGTVARKPFTINVLGLRDRRDLTQLKPAGSCRIAVVGSSVVMGWGVGDEETFCKLLERDLNAAAPGRRLEVLNFGTGISHAIHRRVMLERKVFDFDPDALFYIAHQDEFVGTVRHLTKLVSGAQHLPYLYLQHVVQEARVTTRTPPGETETRLQPFAPRIVRGVYRDIVLDCRKRGVLPVWVYVPMPGVVNVSVRTEELVGLAEEAGFVVLNLSTWADGYAPKEVKVDEHHANALGHRLIAERLRAALRARPDALPARAQPK